ncbi:MAG: tRNA (adenosine(37)-N6)-dimethylallyltransferase MiaA [Deltaproteobacteria bacterium]|nr:tRNA (adenosine(37)-N6)-dimethylallyltransferase MiaA [Deltaproteobacteria bacterium]
MKPKLVIIVGPTAVGKSAVALELAAKLNAEIISADSQLVYRGLDIGAAKPSPEQREQIHHHLIDIVNPDEEFNAAMYRSLATRAAEDIRRRGKNALVCGGTGLYIKAFIKGLFSGPERDWEIRKELESEIVEYGLPSLFRRLQQVDPPAATWIHPNDRQRILRALEVLQLTGRPMSQWQKSHGFNESGFAALTIGLDRERRDLYNRIDRRCEQMLAGGLMEEVEKLLAEGYSLNLKSFQSVGYRHMGLVIKGEMKIPEALELMQRDTRRLAKRQITWFRGESETQWLHPEDRERIFTTVASFFNAEQREID